MIMEKTVQPAIQVFHLNKTFHIYDDKYNTVKHRLFHIFKRNPVRHLEAIKEVHLDIIKGETVGIIGRNGSGKSTLIKCMAGIYQPSKGYVKLNGNMMLLNLGVGMSHELTARENIYVSGSALGMKISDIDRIFNDIISFAELEDFIDTKIKYFSSGMVQRLAFSIASQTKADIMFLDEVFAVGDGKFYNKAVKVVEQNWLEGRTTVIVSHSMNLVGKYCKKVIYLKKGEVAFYGDTSEAIKRYEADNTES